MNKVLLMCAIEKIGAYLMKRKNSFASFPSRSLEESLLMICHYVYMQYVHVYCDFSDCENDYFQMKNCDTFLNLLETYCRYMYS